MPSVSATPAASASARRWLTMNDATSAMSASAADVRWPCSASDQNRAPNTITSATRSSVESRNAPHRLASPRARATLPSKMSSMPAIASTTAGRNRRPVSSSHAAITLPTSEITVRCQGWTPILSRPASTQRKGHSKTFAIAGPIEALGPPGRGHVANARGHSGLVRTQGTVSSGIHATKRGQVVFTAEATPTSMSATRNSSAVRAILRFAFTGPS